MLHGVKPCAALVRRPVISAVHRVIGPYVISARKEMEQAFHSSFTDYFHPLGIEVRWLNYTTRPSTNLGEQSAWGSESRKTYPAHWLPLGPCLFKKQDWVQRSGGISAQSVAC